MSMGARPQLPCEGSTEPCTRFVSRGTEVGARIGRLEYARTPFPSPTISTPLRRNATRTFASSQLPQRPHEQTEDRKRPLTAEAAWRLRWEHRDRPSQDFGFLRRQVGHALTVANTCSTR